MTDTDQHRFEVQELANVHPSALVLSWMTEAKSHCCAGEPVSICVKIITSETGGGLIVVAASLQSSYSP